MKNYLFYDIETTGLNKAFDQVVQFAAIRTDTSLNEVDRYQYLVQLRPDVIYSPEALITHRISLNEIKSGLSEYEATLQIHELLNTPDTISIGYNNLGFDDEFLRFSFYRNLLPPYTHQFKNGCNRMDLLPITALYRLFKPDIIDWPELDGKSTLKLEHLSETNSLAEGPAHDAMVDVEATVELARNFYRESEMWSFTHRYFNKQEDMQQVNRLPNFIDSSMGKHSYGLLVEPRMGSDSHYVAPVLFLGNSNVYSNQSLWLRLDRPELTGTQSDKISKTTWVSRKKYGEPGIILPPDERFWDLLDPERREMVNKHKDWLSNHPEIFQSIITYYRNFEYTPIPDVDVDAALYRFGFLSNQEESLASRFHQSPVEQKPDLLKYFDRQVPRKLAIRLLGRNFPDALTGTIKQEYDSYINRIHSPLDLEAPIDYRGNRKLTPVQALHHIEAIKKDKQLTLDAEQKQLLGELERHINTEHM